MTFVPSSVAHRGWCAQLGQSTDASQLPGFVPRPGVDRDIFFKKTVRLCYRPYGQAAISALAPIVRIFEEDIRRVRRPIGPASFFANGMICCDFESAAHLDPHDKKCGITVCATAGKGSIQTDSVFGLTELRVCILMDVQQAWAFRPGVVEHFTSGSKSMRLPTARKWLASKSARTMPRYIVSHQTMDSLTPRDLRNFTITWGGWSSGKT